jgi:hypothetical protein
MLSPLALQCARKRDVQTKSTGEACILGAPVLKTGIVLGTFEGSNRFLSFCLL